MTTSRRTATNENISTYGDGTRDYTSLLTWEGATDNDLVTAMQSEILECYPDASPYDDGASLLGATTDSNYYRIIRAAPAHRHNGDVNAGVRFNHTALGGYSIGGQEANSGVEDIVIQATKNSASDQVGGCRIGSGGVAVGVICIDCTNTGASTADSFRTDNGHLINCISIRPDRYGFWRTSGTTGVAYNSVAIGGTHGFINVRNVTNCICQDVSTVDYSGVTGTFATSIDEDGTAQITATLTFANKAADNYHLSASDSTAIDAGTDLSSDGTYPFNDDIDGDTITTWDIGFDEFILEVSDAVTLDRTTRAYGTNNGDGQYEIEIVQTSNFVYHIVNDGETDATTYVLAHVDSFSFFTDLEEAQAIAALIVAGGV